MKEIILIGGGHAHLSLIQKLKKSQINAYKITLISNTPTQYYSGMVSGYLEGFYTKEAMTVDLYDFCRQKGIGFIQGNLLKINEEDKTIQLQDQQVLNYHILSINIGAKVDTSSLEIDERCFPVKPLKNIESLLEKVLNMKKTLPMAAPKILVLGTGAAGLEIGLALSQRLKDLKLDGGIKFIGSHEDLLKGYPKRASDQIMALTKNRSIEYLTSTKGLGIEGDALVLDSGQSLKFDLLILATGAHGHAYNFLDDLPLNDQRFISVDKYLRVKETRDLFAVGDCIDFHDGCTIPKNGVLALDQSKILYANLMRCLASKNLKPYKARKTFLSIIALGHKKALLSFGNLAISGKWPWYLKVYIDKKYMKKLKG